MGEKFYNIGLWPLQTKGSSLTLLKQYVGMRMDNIKQYHLMEQPALKNVSNCFNILT